MHTNDTILRDDGDGMEHRWGRRKSCRAGVWITAGPGVSGIGRMRDVSISGAYVETQLNLPSSGVITLTVANPDRSPGEHVLASIVRRDREGAGIEWCETPALPICRMLGCRYPCALAPPEESA